MTSKIVHLRSDNLNQTTDDRGYFSGFTVTLNNPSDIHMCKRISPVHISIPNLFENVTVANNTLTYSVNGVVGLTTVPLGHYDAATLLSVLSASLSTVVQAAGGGAGSVVFSINGLTSVVSVANADQATLPLKIVSPLNTLSLSPHIGLQAGTTFTCNTTATPVPYPAVMFPMTHVLVGCHAHFEMKGVSSDSKPRDTIASVPLAGRGVVSEFTPGDLESWSVDYNGYARNVHQWGLSFTDSSYNPVFLPPNCAVDVFLRLDFVK